MNSAHLLRLRCSVVVLALSGMALTACDRLSSRQTQPRPAAPAASEPRTVEGVPLPAVTVEGVTLPAEDSRRLAPPTSGAPGSAAPELSPQALQQAREQFAREQATQQRAKLQVDMPVPKGPHRGVIGNTDKPVSQP